MFVQKNMCRAVMGVALAVFFSFSVECFASAVVLHENGRLTVRAFDRPLEEILEGISSALDADIYVAEECRRDRITIDLVSVPVESALSRILRSLSYAALYEGSGSHQRISGLKVYPRGKAGAPVVLVRRGETQGGEVSREDNIPSRLPESTIGSSGAAAAPGTARRGPGHRGVFLPERPAITGSISIASVRAIEGLERERELHAEIRALEAQAAGAGDEDAREALNISLIEKIQEFHRIQKANRNAQAALRRLELFNAQKAGDTVQ